MFYFLINIFQTHGTGTKVGDPTEVEGISRVFQHHTGRPTLIGSIKPSLGHSEGASGLSSIIKIVLALEHRLIPATIGIKSINRNIRSNDWNIQVAADNRAWPESLVPRASVNSFGFGGANGHVVLEAADAHILSAEDNAFSSGYQCGEQIRDEVYLLVLSARTEHSLARMAEGIARYVDSRQKVIDLESLAYTLNYRRSRLQTRGFWLASSSSLQDDLTRSNLVLSSDSSSSSHPFAFVYTGQGSQWPGMGMELMSRYPVFKNSIQYLDTCLQELHPEVSPSWSLEVLLLARVKQNDIHGADKAQSVCTAVQIALTDLLASLNVRPKSVVGHSSGEIGAAYATGILTARQAIMLAFYRGLAVSKQSHVGAMLAIGLDHRSSQSIVEELGLQEQIGVACINSPEHCTLSGDAEAIDKLLNGLQKRKIFARKLETNRIAYHSRHMAPTGSLYQDMLDTAWCQSSRPASDLARSYLPNHEKSTTRMISTVTGTEVTPVQVMSPDYWRKNLESPVLFEDAIRVLLESEQYHFIEIGPHSSLELPIKQICATIGNAQDQALYNSVLIRGKNATLTTLRLLGTLFVHGHDQVLLGDPKMGSPSSITETPKLIIDLPNYPWDYNESSLWYEPRYATEFRNRRYPRHDLLGSRIPTNDGLTATWRNKLDVNETDWIRDHCLGPSIVYPAAAYLAMAIEGICQVKGLQLHECPGIDMRNFNLIKALDFDREQQSSREVFTEMSKHQISSSSSSGRWWQFKVSSFSPDGTDPTTHANGLVSLSQEGDTNIGRLVCLARNGMEQQATRVWYQKFKEEGLNWGTRFAVLQEIFCDRHRLARQASSTTQLLQGGEIGSKKRKQYIVHPISIDAMLQTAFVATTGGWVSSLRCTVPVSMQSVHISAPTMLDMDTCKPWSIDAVSEKAGFGTVNIDAELYNQFDQVLVRMKNVRCIAYQGKVQNDGSQQRNPLARVGWKPDITTFVPRHNDSFSRYLDWFAGNCHNHQVHVEAKVKRLAGALDLIAHKWPNLRMLELGGSQKTTTFFMTILRADSSLRRFDSYHNGSIDREEGFRVSDATPNPITHESRLERPSDDTKYQLVISLSVRSNSKQILREFCNCILIPS